MHLPRTSTRLPRLPHVCDEDCICPIHETQLFYAPTSDEHACQDVSCRYAHGLERQLIIDILSLHRVYNSDPI